MNTNMYINNFTNQLINILLQQCLSNALLLISVLSDIQNDDILAAVFSPDRYLHDTINSTATTQRL